MASILKIRGRWRALVRRRGVSRCQTFDTKGAAQTWARRLESEIDASGAGGHAPARGTTVADLIRRYRREVRPVKPWGRTKDYSLATLEAGLGDRQAATLTVGDITAYAQRRAGEARSRGGTGEVSITAELIYLGRVLRIARQVWRLDVPTEIVADAREALRLVHIGGRGKQRDRRPTAAELDRLRAHFAGLPRSAVPMVDLIDFSIATAMRQAEVTGLRWADLNLEKRTVVIRSRKHPDAGERRDDRVPLLDGAFEIALRQPRAGERIFPYNPKSIGAAFTRACTKLGIEDLRWHDLRHEGASRLFEQGYSVPQVALVTGHRDWAQLRRYTNLRPEDLHRD